MHKYFYFLFFIFFTSFSNLQKLDRRILSVQEAKFIHALRVTRGHQNHGVSSNSMRYEIFLLVLFLSYKLFNGLGLA